MLAIEVEFLTGRYVATAYNDRQNPEWPPHPARVFSALVATWADGGGQLPCDAERAALQWLERAGAPGICASACSSRSVMTHYVPVNDVSVLPDLGRYSEKVETARVEERTCQAVASEAGLDGDPAKLKKASRNLVKARKRLEQARADLAGRKRRAIDASGPVTSQGKKSARAMIPAHRIRQPRFFPSVTPDDPVAVLRWDVDLPTEHREALMDLLSRVVRIGHSSSLVRCSLRESAPEPRFVPDDAGDQVLRVPQSGQLERLEQQWQQHHEVEPRVLPCRFQRYRCDGAGASRPIPAPVLGDDWIVWRRISGRHLHVTRAVDLALAIRGALMEYADDPPLEVLSGHAADGCPSSRPHAAVVPLPFVGHAHADGRLLGAALVLPRDLEDFERRAVLGAIGRWEEAHRVDDEEAPTVPVLLGTAGRLGMERIAWGVAPLAGLRSSTWCRPARTWLSATPVALDRNPGNLSSRSHETSSAAYRAAEDSIAEACAHIGLPRPQSVVVLPSVTMPGVAKARQFPGYPRDRDRVQRVKVHARITFAEPVQGPILLGAGRYQGLGLFRPFPGEDETDAATDR